MSKVRECQVNVQVQGNIVVNSAFFFFLQIMQKQGDKALL